MADRFTVTERSGLGIATVMARKDVAAGDIGRALGLDLSDGAHRTASSQLILLGSGPGQWLALTEDAPDDWGDELTETLKNLASVSDQSGGYLVFRLTGPDARRLLQRGVSIDLHPAAFTARSVATTMVAHIGITLWRPGRDDAFDVAVFRSFSVSFREWLDATARRS